MELIGAEEIEEKANMRAGDIKILLSESTGIQVQQTSATSANASIRIQGLDGRYTQLMKDGFPVYSGAASGLGLLQTPPLDLKQVEIIKGSASTLYGGGAIAGLVNLISKTPSEEKDLRFHLSGSSSKGVDFSSFYSQRNNSIGTTIFAAYSRNDAYDPSGIDFTAIPKFERYVLNSRLFIYFSNRTHLSVGLNSTVEDRIGGDIQFIQGKSDSIHSYFEKNKTQRYSTQLFLNHKFDNRNSINFRSSVNYFERTITIPNYLFDGIQIGSFSEINFISVGEKAEWIAGVNLVTEQFYENIPDTFLTRDNKQYIYGVFLQHSWKVTPRFNLETGLRADYENRYGILLLPRISVLFKGTSNLTSPIGGGLGYKTPTIFTEESERIHYRNVLPINYQTNKIEKSYGGNMDINFRTLLGDKITLNFNHLFFYTYLNHPLILERQTGGFFSFINSSGHVDTRGTETNIKIGYYEFNLFLGYTYTDARLHTNGVSTPFPLTPHHRINSVLIFEKDEKWKAGVEAYYYSRQKLNDGTTGKAYVIGGIMVERTWKKLAIYINFENIFDVRQTRFGPIYYGSHSRP
ncbi:MAG: TonB-dependent receptor plug domain-containing protein, partial [Bacteroidales bacterium]